MASCSRKWAKKKILLRQTSERNCRYWSAVKTAVSHNDTEKLDKLLKTGIDPNANDRFGRTLLHIACSKGYSEIVKILLQYNASVHLRDSLGNTPLHIAICSYSTDVTNLLLAAGASVTATSSNGCTPIVLAQSKLRLLQTYSKTECTELKASVEKIIKLMSRLAENNSEEAALVSAFNSRLKLSQTTDQVTQDLKSLLDSLDNLHLQKPNQKLDQRAEMTESNFINITDSLKELNLIKKETGLATTMNTYHDNRNNELDNSKNETIVGVNIKTEPNGISNDMVVATNCDSSSIRTTNEN